MCNIYGASLQGYQPKKVESYDSNAGPGRVEENCQRSPSTLDPGKVR